MAAEFADPHRLATLGVTRFVRFAANRGLRVRRSAADRLVAAARTALPAPEAVVARQVLADDLGLLAELDVQIAAAEAQIGKLPDTPFAVLPTVPGWGHDPGRQLRRRGRRPAPVADRLPALSRSPDCPQPNTSRRGSVGTAASAGKAACNCGGR